MSLFWFRTEVFGAERLTLSFKLEGRGGVGRGEAIGRGHDPTPAAKEGTHWPSKSLPPPCRELGGGGGSRSEKGRSLRSSQRSPAREKRLAPAARGSEPSRDQPDHRSCSEISPRANFSSALLNKVRVGNGTGRPSSKGELVPSKSNGRSPTPLPSGEKLLRETRRKCAYHPKAKTETSYLVLRVWLW